ncbi:hypothetical protein FQN57_006658 [Myotisia sp. PD_48]|nr:hypothetical protein FQN57_006658 [Myotisia sp. PD_48]
MSVKSANFESSEAFDQINAVLANDDATRQEAITNVNGIFTFTLTNEDRETESWYLDFKKKGVAGKGTAPDGEKAEVTLVLSEKDFGSLVSGSSSAQRLFMSGKLKIRGNIMKATKIEAIFSKIQTKAKL